MRCFSLGVLVAKLTISPCKEIVLCNTAVSTVVRLIHDDVIDAGFDAEEAVGIDAHPSRYAVSRFKPDTLDLGHQKGILPYLLRNARIICEVFVDSYKKSLGGAVGGQHVREVLQVFEPVPALGYAFEFFVFYAFYFGELLRPVVQDVYESVFLVEREKPTSHFSPYASDDA